MAPRNPPAPVPAYLPAPAGTCTAYLTPDGELKRQLVVGYRVHTADESLDVHSLIVLGPPLDPELNPVLLDLGGVVVDFSAEETYEDLHTWMGARGVIAPVTEQRRAPQPDPRKAPLSEADVAAINLAVEQLDDPRDHVAAGPSLPGERQRLPGQENPTAPPGLDEMANDPERIAALARTEIAEPAKAVEDWEDLI